MRQHKRKSTAPGSDRFIQGFLRDEIVADVFELWLGISRLMAKVSGKSDLGPNETLAKENETPVNRKPRRKAA